MIKSVKTVRMIRIINIYPHSFSLSRSSLMPILPKTERTMRNIAHILSQRREIARASYLPDSPKDGGKNVHRYQHYSPKDGGKNVHHFSLFSQRRR